MVMLHEVMFWLRYGYVMAVAMSQLPCQPGENKRVCTSYGSSSLLPDS